eukprot:scaffold7759_cov62-Cylindrotheca_fusiformis.AAC.2
MERPNIMDKRNKKRQSSEIEAGPKYFVYTSETKDADIPKETLTHLRVDSSVSEIPEKVFWGCESLVHVQLSESPTRIQEFAFFECFNLNCVQFVSRNDPLDDASSINVNSEQGKVVFPETAKLQIDTCAFGNCWRLRKVIVCSVSTRLGDKGFFDCIGLISARLPDGLQEIRVGLFSCCKSLTTVNIPTSVIKIGEYAFSGCESLTSFDLPHGLVHIGDGSFFGCISIEIHHIPTTVSSIGERAFEDCRSLKYVRLPPTLETLESEVFKDCYGLEYIVFPTKLKRIGSCPFENCSSLSHIRIPPGVELIAHDAFDACDGLISLEIPEEIEILLNFDLSNSFPLLVNIAGPMLYVVLRYMEIFMRVSKLGSVVAGYDDCARYDDLVRRLQHRFDDSPLNKLCYYHSYHSPDDAMMQLQSLMGDDPLAATTEVDEFGLTPLHTLSLSQTPNLDMLLALMKESHLDHIIYSRDSFGSTPMDYLCQNRLPNSTQVIRKVLMTRFDYFLGLDSPWKSDMLQAVDSALDADWSSKRKEIVAVFLKLVNYERKEIFSEVELFLWKMKIDEVGSEEEEQIVDRESCRINSGAAIVIPHVQSFLGKFDGEDFF